jgi:two-component system response regulator (stage 0 sporulation protein A)
MLFDIFLIALKGKSILPLKYNSYVYLAEKYKKNTAAVEKDIQNAISTAWLKADVDVLFKEFGETIDIDKGKPTNKQFILTALTKLNNFEKIV